MARRHLVLKFTLVWMLILLFYTQATMVFSQSPAPTMAVTDHLRLWLKADTDVTIDGTQHVSQWLDQSTNGCHAAQLTALNQPLLVQNALNGRRTIRFDGINNYLSTPPIISTGNNFSLFVVFKKEGVPTVDHPIAVLTSTFTALANYFNLNSRVSFSSETIHLND
jgi:hypothetical protein